MRILVTSILVFSSFSLYAQYVRKDQDKPSKIMTEKDSLFGLQATPISRSILLKEVSITSSPYYKADSLRLRKEFAAVFNSRQPTLFDAFTTKNPNDKTPIPYNKARSSTASIAGINVLSIIALLGKNKTPRSKLQQNLLDKETADYIDHIFSKQKVRELTGLQGDSLQVFMQRYRPNVSEAQKMGAYELLIYIKECHKIYSTTN